MKSHKLFTTSIIKKLTILVLCIVVILIILSLVEFISYDKRLTIEFHPVAQIMTPDGKVLKEFKKLDNPACISVTDNNEILICDKANKRFVIKDNKGKDTWVYPAKDPIYIEKTTDNTYILTDINYAYEVNKNKDILWKSNKYDYLCKVSKLNNGNYIILAANGIMFESFNVFTPGYHMFILRKHLPKEEVKKLFYNIPSCQVPLPRISQLIQVNRKNKLLFNLTSLLKLNRPTYFQVLQNGNLLVADYGNKRVIELDSKLNIINRPYLDSSYIYNALLLPDDNIAFVDIFRNYYHLISPQNTLLAEQKCFYAKNMSLTPEGNIALIRFIKKEPKYHDQQKN